MSASEMERLKAENTRLKEALRKMSSDREMELEAESASLRERLREVERVWREERGDVEAAIRLAVYAPLPENSKRADDAAAGAAAFTRLYGALSGGSAPQAPNSEELLKALRAARHALEVFLEAQASGSANHLKLAATAARAALSMKSEGSDPACTCGSADDTHKITCAKLAYLLRPPTGPFPPPPESEGSDPDSSQKGEP